MRNLNPGIPGLSIELIPNPGIANPSDATKNFLELFQVPQTEFEHFRYRFRGIISERRVFRKRGELENWNSQVFFYHQEVADDVEGAIITKSEK